MDGAPLGLFVADYFTRDSKRGGAWMSSAVGQSRLLHQRPVVVNTMNLPKPPPGAPALMGLDEVRTMFHEFGHALHGLFSAVTYPRLAGTAVARDFVEYPSQVNEVWLTWPSVLDHYARHVETGEPLPQELLERVEAARADAQGYASVASLAATCHRSGLAPADRRRGGRGRAGDVLGFEERALAAAGLDLPEVTPRYRSAYFNHIFAGGYSAGYYSYVWSEVLDADTVAWFLEHGGLVRALGGPLPADPAQPRGDRPRDELRHRLPRPPAAHRAPAPPARAAHLSCDARPINRFRAEFDMIARQ